MEAIPNRFMFDTSALNRLCDNERDFDRVIASLQRGHQYFFTEAQCEEAKRTIKPHKPAEPIQQTDIVQRAERAFRLIEIVARMQPTFVKQFATLYPGGWPLDGSRILWPDDDRLVGLFRDICNDNPKHHNDAIIASAATHNGLILVTHDRRLYNKTNAHYQGRAMMYASFIDFLGGKPTTMR